MLKVLISTQIYPISVRLAFSLWLLKTSNADHKLTLDGCVFKDRDDLREVPSQNTLKLFG